MRFRVENMNCAHCESSIRRALAALAPEASVAVDLRGKSIDVDERLSAAQVVQTLAAAGYTAVRASELA